MIALRCTPSVGLLVVIGLLQSSRSEAQASGPVSGPPDWPSYNRTLAGDRYSPLATINRSNVARLRQVCTFVLPEVSSLQTGPLVVAGTMYFTTDTISYAIDAATCRKRWQQSRHNPTPSQLLVNRGFAYLDGRLFRGTSDSHVLALDARDGRLLWDHLIDEKAPGVSIPMAPIAWKGMVFIGHAGGDQVGVTGHVYALDAKDGHVVWRFAVVPDMPEVLATWPNPDLHRSGGGFWTSFTLDTTYGVLYVPAGNPAPDFDIGVRTGDNLYTNSVIALDAATGRMLGYNQIVQRDSHDWDVDSPPALVITRSGRAIIASANKDGLLTLLDRSRLQTRTPTTAGDLSAALPVLSRSPTTTRENPNVPLSRERIIRFCPGILGGAEWNGAAYSPQVNSIFTGAVDWCASVQLKRDSTHVPAAGESWFGAENDLSTMFDPPDKAKGWISAFDAENGLVRWRYRASRPVLAGVTPTAGGLLFTADLGGEIYGLDVNSGRVLWQMASGQSTGGGVITYIAGGRQLLAVASGMKSPVWPGAAAESRIVVYGLP